MADTHLNINMTLLGSEIIIKISYVLNVSHSISKREEFSFKDIEVLVDSEEQNWSKRTHIGQYLGIACIITSTATLSEEDIRSRAFIQAEVGIHSMDPIPREDTQYHFADWCPLCHWKLSKR